MTTFGLVVEGKYDEAVLHELIQKCVSGEVKIIGRQCGSGEKLLQMFPTLLGDFQGIVKAGTTIDKALVIRDTDNKDPSELEKTMHAKIANRTYPFSVRPLVVVRELEAWLLADENAISGVMGKRVTKVQNPEGLPDPKERLKRVLSKARKPYTSEIARQIAANAKIETIESRCPSVPSHK